MHSDGGSYFLLFGYILSMSISKHALRLRGQQVDIVLNEDSPTVLPGVCTIATLASHLPEYLTE